MDESESNLNSEDVVTVNVNLRYMGTEPIENVTLSISIPEPIYTDDISIVIPSIGSYALPIIINYVRTCKRNAAVSIEIFYKIQHVAIFVTRYGNCRLHKPQK